MKNGGDDKQMSKFDWDSFPKYYINCGKLSEPFDICRFFKKHKIDKYVYTILYDDMITVKDGMSAAKSISRIWGERIYRQIAHAFSWGIQRIDGSSGADWLIIERDFKEKYGIDLDHRKLTLVVWDVSNYNFQSFDPFKEVEKMESEKINEYIQRYGEKPIGNINDEANKRNRTYVPKELYNSFIEEIN